MRNKFLLAIGFALFCQLSCWAGIISLSTRQLLESGSQFLLILTFLIILPIGIIFYVMNKRFVSRYPVLQGRYFWSLLFFPLFAIFYLGFITILSIPNSRYFYSFFGPVGSVLLVIIPFGLFILSIIIQSKILKSLLDWNYDSIKLISRYILIIVALPPINDLIGKLFFINTYEIFFDSVAGIFIFEIVFGGLLWFLAKNALEQINQSLTKSDSTYYSVPETLAVNQKKPNLSTTDSEKLLKMKELYDAGLLSQSEFERMKKDILNKRN